RQIASKASSPPRRSPPRPTRRSSAADIRLHISWRHHARVMAKLHQLARPMMRRPAGLEPHQTRRQQSEKLQQLVAPDRDGAFIVHLIFKYLETLEAAP